MILSTALGRLTAQQVGRTRTGSPVMRILGIPYARARRFRSPVPVGAPCGQAPVNSGLGHCFPQRLVPGAVNIALRHFQLRPEWQPRRDVMGEDSLRVNVWTSGTSAPKPVLVLIHGGDCGSGTLPVYDGTHLAEQGIVVVTVTYRIGALGHLHVVDGDRVSCDRGLLDQQMALRWVRENIGELGGDPDSITLLGHCGGAQYALYQALNPDTTGSSCAAARGPHPYRWTPMTSAEPSRASCPTTVCRAIGSWWDYRSNACCACGCPGRVCPPPWTVPSSPPTRASSCTTAPFPACPS